MRINRQGEDFFIETQNVAPPDSRIELISAVNADWNALQSTLLCGMTMRMLRTGWQLGEVQARQVEQGDIHLPLSGLHPLTVAPEMLPPGIECHLAFSRGPIFFICDDNG